MKDLVTILKKCGDLGILEYDRQSSDSIIFFNAKVELSELYNLVLINASSSSSSANSGEQQRGIDNSSAGSAGN